MADTYHTMSCWHVLRTEANEVVSRSVTGLEKSQQPAQHAESFGGNFWMSLSWVIMTQRSLHPVATSNTEDITLHN